MADGSCMPVLDVRGGEGAQTGIVSNIKGALVADFGRSEEQLRTRYVIHHNRRSEHDEIAHAIDFVESGGLNDGDGDDVVLTSIVHPMNEVMW